jgi:hypothetical protein
MDKTLAAVQAAAAGLRQGCQVVMLTCILSLLLLAVAVLLGLIAGPQWR